MNLRPVLLLGILLISALLIFMASANEKVTDRVIRLQLEKTKETPGGETVTEMENVVIYDQDDVNEIEEKLRELGYIE